MLESQMETLLKHRDSRLPELISSITNQPLQCKLLVNDLKEATEYMRTYNLKNAEREIFKFVLPVIIKHMDKAYCDNSSLIEIADDDMITFVIKENLMVSSELIKIVKNMLLFVSEAESVEIMDIESITSGVPTCIGLFFHHFRICFESYSNHFNEEASVLFEEVQELYIRILNLLEDYVVINDKDGVMLLFPTINFIYEFTVTLFDIDFKLVYSGWKTLSILIDKYAELMQDVIDLNLPINCMVNEVEKVLGSLLEQDLSAFHGYMKVINFFLKFLVKFCDNFYQRFEKFSLNFICFYIRFLSFSLDRYKSAGIPDNELQIIEKTAYYTLEELLRHFIQLNNLLKVQIKNILHIPEIEVECKNYPLGVLHFLNMTLKIVSEEKSLSGEVIPVSKAIFSVLDKNYKGVFYEGFHSRGLFETLIVNISSAILNRRNCDNFERFLVEQILQESPIQSGLALEIYTVLLSYQEPNHLKQTLVSLLNAANDLHVGKFTTRPEHVYLQSLLIRIFKMLPLTCKMEIQETFKRSSNYQIWRTLGCGNQSAKTFIHQIVTFSKTGELKSGKKEQFFNIAECLEICAISNSNKEEDLREAISRLWEINLSPGWNVTDNNVVKYFLSKLILATSSFINQFSPDQLTLILNQLCILSKNESYLVWISKMLKLYFDDSVPLHSPIDQLLQKIVMNFLNSDSALTKELCFDLLTTSHSFKQFFTRNVTNLLNEKLKSEVLSQLDNKDVHEFNYESINERFQYVHKCIEWYKTPYFQGSHDRNVDVDFKINEMGDFSTNNNDSNEEIPKKRPKTTLGASKRHLPVVNTPTEPEDDSVSDVLKSLKGEVKCLIKATQRKKLSSKNAADLKIIIRDLNLLV